MVYFNKQNQTNRNMMIYDESMTIRFESSCATHSDYDDMTILSYIGVVKINNNEPSYHHIAIGSHNLGKISQILLKIPPFSYGERIVISSYHYRLTLSPYRYREAKNSIENAMHDDFSSNRHLSSWESSPFSSRRLLQMRKKQNEKKGE